MRQTFLFFACLFLMQALHAQSINTKLKSELDSIFTLDQKYRAMLGNNINKDSLSNSFHIKKEVLPDYLWTMQIKVDSSNIHLVKKIISQYGYPGKTLVGVPTNEAAFYIIQHSNDIDKYLTCVREAAEKKELPFYRYAMMLDRFLMYQGKEQIYGTQAKGFTFLNKQKGTKEFKMIIWPVKDHINVNKMRFDAGFDKTVEENAKRLGIEYTVYTLEDYAKMIGK